MHMPEAMRIGAALRDKIEPGSSEENPSQDVCFPVKQGYCEIPVSALWRS
jgi:hypothetical protein